jgi:hypothetical protein
MKKICVIDGQGGGIGSAIIKTLKQFLEERVELIALGTNAIATATMLKAKANRGASGENAIVQSVKSADIIIGSISIIMAQAMLGEVTPQMASAIAASQAKKILLPLSQENIEVVGVSSMPLPRLIEAMVTENLSEMILNK